MDERTRIVKRVQARFRIANVVEPSIETLPLIQLEDIESGRARIVGEGNWGAPDGQNRFRPGDVLFSKLRPYLAKCLLVTTDAHGTGELLCLRPGPQLDARYLLYLTLSRPWIDHAVLTSYGTKMPRTSWEKVAEFGIPDIEVDEQRRIADFLDDRVARVDQIITARRAQEVSLGLLHETRKEAVFDGSTNAPTVQLRRLRCLVQTGPFGSQLHSDEYVDGGWPVVNPAGIVDGRLREIAGMSVDDRVRERLSRHILLKNDVVFGRRGELGRAGLVTESEVGWVCGTGSLLVRLADEGLRPPFLMQMLSTSRVRHFFQRHSVGSTMDNLNTDILLSVPLLLPTVADQDAILDALDQLDRDLSSSVRALEESVSLMLEYKQSLITAAVTGELDVTTAGSGIPNPH